MLSLHISHDPSLTIPQRALLLSDTYYFLPSVRTHFNYTHGIEFPATLYLSFSKFPTPSQMATL